MGADSSKPAAAGKANRRGSKHVMSLQELRDLSSHLETGIQFVMNRVSQLSADGGTGWAQEYTRFSGINAPATASGAEANVLKNRYRNIVAYDHSRVKVKPNKYNGQSDYINASYVAGYGGARFIATQGPVPESFVAFWQMMWEQKCRVIAMVTNEIEGDRLKCHRYWPEEEQTEVRIGPFVIVNGPRKDKTHYVVRHLMLRNTDTNEEREIVHFMYTAWPDHGVPNTTAEMLQFRKAVFKEQSDNDILMIHCSAGVGRTGTFIAIDSLMRMAENGITNLDPFPVVEEMRHARNYLVQTLVQYQFVFKTILDALNKRLSKVKKALHENTGGEGGQQLQEEAELQELSSELADVNDDLAGIDEEVERELKGGQQEAQVDADARYDGHEPKDRDLAKRVSRVERLESLMSYVTSDDWKRNVQDAKPATDKLASLSQRMESLSAAVASEAWREQYSHMTANWASKQTTGGEEYEVETALTPLESRILSLAQQQEAMKLKSEEARQSLRDEQLKKVASLTDRFMELNSTVIKADERWRARGDGLRGEGVVDRTQHTAELMGDVRNRLMKLQQDKDAWRTRGDGFRGVVKEKDYYREATAQAAEVVPPATPSEADKAPATAAPASEVKPKATAAAATSPATDADDGPVKATVYELPDDGWKPIVNLKKRSEAKKAHPMVAAASKSKPMLRKASHPMVKK